jgi:DNA segregation ATPase FtsK/SpoIIIE-like protein
MEIFILIGIGMLIAISSATLRQVIAVRCLCEKRMGKGGVIKQQDKPGVDEDELFEEAKNVIIEERKASTSYFQRRLRIGYAYASRLMDRLEEAGVVGPYRGSRSRRVLIEEQEGDNELFERAKKIIIESQIASPDYLQKELRIGYARTARIMDELEEEGFIGPGERTKPREVLVKE